MNQTTNSDIQTIIKSITGAQTIVIALPKVMTLDALCAAIALHEAIILSSSAQQRTVTITSAAADIPAAPFLQNIPLVQHEVPSGNQLAIKISNSHAQPGELRYEKVDDGLTVFITPKQGSGVFTKEDVSVIPAANKVDLVIIIGAANFEELGKLYTENTKLFFETTNINIDINPENEYYGTINFVQPSASSFSEVVMDIVTSMPKALENKTISTGLLAGIISQTGSFRDPKTTPQALMKASKLVDAGANRQDIVQYLFKTKPLPLLQLWGRALARLTASTDKKVLTAIVTLADVEKTQVAHEDLPIILRDIIEMVTGYSLAALFVEEQDAVQILLAGLPHENISKIAKELAGDTDAPPQKTKEPQVLTGKYQYINVTVEGDVDAVQQKFTQIVEAHNSVI